MVPGTVRLVDEGTGSDPRRRGTFVVAGVPVRVQVSALVTLAVLWVLVYTDVTGSRLGSGGAIAIASVAAVAFLLSVLVHELAHAVTARMLELRVREVTVFYLGGVTRLEQPPEDSEHELAIAVAGPLTNLLLAGVLLVSAEVVGRGTAAGVVLTFLGDLNAVIGVFNLLPAHPLDGGAILRALLTWATGDVVAAARWSSRAGQLLGAVLVVAGVLGGFASGEGGSFGMLWLAVIGMFVLGASRAGLLQADARARLQDVTVADLAQPLRWIGEIDWTVAMVVARVARTQGVGLVVDSGNRAVGIFGPDDLAEVPTNHWEHLTLGEAMDQVLGSVDVATPVIDILHRFADDREVTLSVTEHGQHVGLLRAEDILARLRA